MTTNSNPTKEIKEPDIKNLQEEKELKPAFPTQFLCEIGDKLAKTIDEVLRAYGVPKKVADAVDSLVFLQMTISTHPEEYVPGGLEGYNREMRGAVEDNAWLIETLSEIRREKVHSMTDEEYQAASTSWK